MDNLYQNIDFNITIQENNSMYLTNCGVIWLN